MTANGLAASKRLASFVAAWNAAGFRTHLFGLNQLALLLRLGFALRFGEWICLWWRVNTLCVIHQIFDREDLDFGIGTTIDRTR